MKQNLVDIKLHGDLGKTIGETWKLAVSSVSEAIHAIESISKRKLYKYLHEKDKDNVKYRVLINGRDFLSEETPVIEKPESIVNSELVMPSSSLKTIDIVPVLYGSDENVGAIIAGVLLIIVGIVVAGMTFGGAGVIGAALIIGGLGLIAAGVINLLSQPPKFDDFREISGGGKVSTLFQGPENVTREGGPVPLLYGRLIVGSQVMAASYEVSYRNSANGQITI